MLTPDALPRDLPWQRNAYLFLDGISVSNLRVRLHEWFDAPDFQLLYANTPLASCNAVSPCLLTLNGLQTPGLQPYFTQIAEEWGYLIFSQASAYEVICHLRALLNAQYPQGPNVWLRVADPAVMHALLTHAASAHTPHMFGPMEQVVLPDVVSEAWHHHVRNGDLPQPLGPQPYALCDRQVALLDEVRLRSTWINLHQHVRGAFPHAPIGQDAPARWAWIRQITEEAYGLGFSSEHDICLYANVQVLLGHDGVTQHPDIVELLTRPSSLTPAQRITQAAELALARSHCVEDLTA